MVVPTKHRDAIQLQSEGRLTFTRSPDPCLLLLPRPVWEHKREQIAKWDLQFKAYQRLFLGSASDVEMDNAGRVLIAPELREAAGMSLEAKVMLVGLGTHFEVWEAAAYEASLATAVPSGVPAGFAF
jgi:MraZ protein